MNHNDYVVLDHGTGAKLSQDLIRRITAELGDVHIGKMEDSAILPIEAGEIAVTTDSFVVSPMIFGNGDIGKIAVCGTVNDLSVMGATPVYMTLALIIETGLPIDDLLTVVRSIRDCAREAKVRIVAGDTKVVNKGEADRLFINTTGIGLFRRRSLSMNNVRAGDKLILSGNLGDHSVHVLSLREGLGFEERVVSDCAPLNDVIEALLSSELAPKIKSIRDVTRGGFAEVMHEYAQTLGYNISSAYEDVPVQHETAMAADMLGVDPLHLANEGCLCLFVAPDAADDVVKHLQGNAYTKNAVIVGTVTGIEGGEVLMSKGGAESRLEQLEGAELPRLC